MPKMLNENDHDYCVPTFRDQGLQQVYTSSDPNTACENEGEEDESDPQEKFRAELIKQLKVGSYYDRLMKKLDRGEYKMRKDHMLHRMQIEKDEKDFQDCLCEQEREKEKRQSEICAGRMAAAAMREKKDEEVREAAFKIQLRNCAPEIRELERQIKRAYFAKTLYAQRMEGDALKLEEKVRERENYEVMLEQLEKIEKAEADKLQADFLKKKEYLSELKNQMDGHGNKTALELVEINKDKIMVDEILKLMKEEEVNDKQERVDKLKLYQSEIDHFLKSRNDHREQVKIREQEEEKKRLKYLENKEADVAKFKKEKADQHAAKAAVVAEAIERMKQHRMKEGELEALRIELMEEELQADLRQKELDELARKQKQMMELKEAAATAIRMREERIEFEKKEEEEFRRQLMEKFAEDDHLEQLSQQKRRQREREHRKQVEQMIAERRCLRAQEKEKDQHVRDCFENESGRRVQLINQERLRLLKKHGPEIIGFIPRGVIKSQKELEALGEPFVSYYRDPPLERDPTTVRPEACNFNL